MKDLQLNQPRTRKIATRTRERKGRFNFFFFFDYGKDQGDDSKKDMMWLLKFNIIIMINLTARI